MANEESIHNAEDKLEAALAKLAAGISLDNVLIDAGKDSEWLEPMLAVATEVGELRGAIPIPPADAGLQRLLLHAEQLAARTSSTTSAQPWWRNILPSLGRHDNRQVGFSGGRLAIIVMASLLIVFLAGSMFGSGLILAAEDSLPGQPLYQVKRLGETVRLLVAQDPTTRRWLVESFNERREQEVQLLLERGEQAEVVFMGRIGALTNTDVTIEGLIAQITPETRINGQLEVGARVRVEGVTQPPDGLVALTITVLEPAPPSPTPTSTVSPTPTSTPTATKRPVNKSTSDTIDLPPTPTPSVTPTATLSTSTPTTSPSDSGSSSDSEAAENTPTPTATSTIAPRVESTATSLPTEASNDDSNDNQVDSDNESQDNSDTEFDNSDNDNSDSSSSDNSGSSGGDDSSGSGGSGDDDNSGGSSNSGSGGDGGDDGD